ncbi:MAG: hypothetical protein JWM11_5514 [Planctomycetaceae bacterium]|nr:hypothetical protein [Planctomycetaceae bacterium]
MQIDLNLSLPGLPCSIDTDSMGSQNLLVEQIRSALHRAGYIHLRHLNVRVDGRNVRMDGRLPSYFLKQIAQQTVLKIPGVCVFCDEINVVN